MKIRSVALFFKPDDTRQGLFQLWECYAHPVNPPQKNGPDRGVGVLIIASCMFGNGQDATPKLRYAASSRAGLLLTTAKLPSKIARLLTGEKAISLWLRKHLASK